ncbi:MAG TPA: hypothetical protein PK529_06435 [Verrucomicrobiales bacterium]|nr:hypothetical protein [Verrucomicrobiales bacterium]
MNDTLDALLEKMRLLEREILQELQKKEVEFLYEVRQGRVRFTEAAMVRHKQLVRRFTTFLRGSRFMVLFTAPVIWSCLIPILLLDLFVTIYQAICFPVYGIPKVKRSDYIRLDRRHLAYLNWVEKLNCEYCGYANGVIASASEIAARTEQYWCPIKHALRMKSRHSRYRFFFDYGDAERYLEQIEHLRRSFEDINKEEMAEIEEERNSRDH